MQVSHLFNIIVNLVDYFIIYETSNIVNLVDNLIVALYSWGKNKRSVTSGLKKTRFN
jgi:hypothetical protein